MVIRLTKGRLKVAIAENRAELGEVAAREVAAYIMALQKEKPEVNIIFASAPSQNEFLANLLHYDIDWGRINAFHMDEYIGIDPHAPQSFGQFLRDRIFSKRNFNSVNYINPQAADPEPNAHATQPSCVRCPPTWYSSASGRTDTSPSTTPTWPSSTIRSR